MKAIVIRPGQAGSIEMRDMPEPSMSSDQVLVKMRRVGLCGTDREIHDGLYGEPPAGEDLLILGHENLGVVHEVGAHVQGFQTGDLVVSTVRRPCGQCANCAAGESDCCS